MSDENLNEKVDVDARKGEYRRTVERLSIARQMREAKAKGNKWNGLYDDGSGKGASVPEPIDFNKENRQKYSVEIDGRTRGFREAMQRVEMYKKLREAKKKTLMGNVKESTEITEASNNSIAEFTLGAETSRTQYHVKIAQDPSNKNRLVAKSEAGSFAFPKELFAEFCKSYKAGGSPSGQPKGKEHYGVPQPGDFPTFVIGDTWQKMFIGKVGVKNIDLQKTSPQTYSYPDWLKAISKNAMSESAEITEASSYANDLLDAVEKAYKKGGLRAVIGGAQVFKLDTDTTVDDVLQDMKAIFGNDKKYAATEVKGFLKPQDYAKYKTKVEAWKESIDEAAEPAVEAGATIINGKFAIKEEDLSPAQKKYRAFFNKALKKFGADSPADLDDAKKKELFNYVKKNYKAESHDILPPHGKTLDEEELSKKQKEYRAFFDKALKKFGASSPAKMDDAKKKEFFSYVKANWKG